MSERYREKKERGKYKRHRENGREKVTKKKTNREEDIQTGRHRKTK